ncbi:MAG: MFS transporter [Ignavibacteriae bacterium]|nr:MFS transporter [Ignavibacteriota bacterium]
MNKQKFTILFTVFVDVLGFGIVIPVLPYYVGGDFGASAFTITMLFAVFAFFSFLSSPFLGALSDKIGRRPVLLISIFSTAVGWFVFASAHTIWLLFLGRIIDGVAAGNYTIAQSYLVDIAHDDKERSANLGLIGATWGIGFVVGPSLGGFLSTTSHSLPFLFTGFLALANTVVAYFSLPETLPPDKRRTAPITYNPFTPLARALYDKPLRPLYISWILFGLAFMTSQTVFALYTERALEFDSFTTGLMFTGSGLFMALNQAVFLRSFWLKQYTESQLEFGMLSAMGVSMVLMGIRNPYVFAVSIPILSVAHSTLRVVFVSRAAGLADPTMKGEIIGIMSSVIAAMMVVGPPLAGILFEWNYSLPFFAAAAVCALALWISHKRGKGVDKTVGV